MVENSFEVQTKRGNNDIDVAEWWSERTKIVRKTGSKCILKGRISILHTNLCVRMNITHQTLLICDLRFMLSTGFNECIKHEFGLLTGWVNCPIVHQYVPKIQNVRLCCPNNKNDETICKISLNVINQHFTRKLSNSQRSFRLLPQINQGDQWFSQNDQRQLLLFCQPYTWNYELHSKTTKSVVHLYHSTIKLWKAVKNRDFQNQILIVKLQWTYLCNTTQQQQPWILESWITW